MPAAAAVIVITHTDVVIRIIRFHSGTVGSQKRTSFVAVTVLTLHDYLFSVHHGIPIVQQKDS